MLDRFKKYIVAEHLFDLQKKQLLAVSGGVDSMVLLELMRLMKCKFAVAHCNFALRAQDSDADEDLVKNYCAQHQIQFFVKRFQTKKVAEEKHISIQMAARKLRYEWFDELVKINHFQKIITAHHLDDQVETFLINLIRASGLNGLSGMPISTNKLARPLIPFKKEEIYRFAKDEKVSYREDLSNEDDKYLRNKIRLNIVPQFQELNPNFTESVQQSISYITEAKKIVGEVLKNFIQSAVTEKENQKIIDFKKLQNSPSPALILFELIKPFGFNSDQINSILQPNPKQSGRQFYSESHVLLINRDEIILKEKAPHIYTDKNTFHQLDSDCLKLKDLHTENEVFKAEIISKSELKKFPDGKFKAVFDADKIQQPLEICNWKEGDKFQPFGMEGFKKLSDFFIDEKLSLFEKEKVKVLKSNGQIVWLIGYRIDNRYRVKNESKHIWQIEIK